MRQGLESMMTASRASPRTAQAASHPVSPPPTMATRSARYISRRIVQASLSVCSVCRPGSPTGQPGGTTGAAPVAMTSPS